MGQGNGNNGAGAPDDPDEPLVLEPTPPPAEAPPPKPEPTPEPVPMPEPLGATEPVEFEDVSEADLRGEEGKDAEYERPDLRAFYDAPGPQSASDLKFGDIVVLDDGSVIIYRQPVPDKRVDFIYELGQEGVLEARGMVTRAYAPRKLGRLDSVLFRQMIRLKSWDRDALVHHLDHWALGRYVPQADGSRILPQNAIAAAHTPGAAERRGAPAEPETPPGPERGTRLTIRMGEHSWDAVYWGRDAKGPIVAHDTEGTWYLMHLDLDRFGDNLTFGELLSPQEVAKIDNEVRTLT